MIRDGFLVFLVAYTTLSPSGQMAETPDAEEPHHTEIILLGSLGEDPQNCQFSLPFENPSAGLCPVRICIASEFRK